MDSSVRTNRDGDFWVGQTLYSHLVFDTEEVEMLFEKRCETLLADTIRKYQILQHYMSNLKHKLHPLNIIIHVSTLQGNGIETKRNLIQYNGRQCNHLSNQCQKCNYLLESHTDFHTHTGYKISNRPISLLYDLITS